MNDISCLVMLKARALILFAASLLVMVAGCRSADSDGIVAYSAWGDAADTKARLNSYKHILLGCIYEDHWEDRGPHEYSYHHFMATVVRSYKGDWRISDKVLFVQGLDYPALTASNASVGRLVFLFTDEHKNTEIGFETGDVMSYETELGQALQYAYPERRGR